MTSRCCARPHRICVVAPALPPAVGGAEVVAESMIKILIDCGHVVDVLSGTGDASVRAVVEAGGGVYRVVGRDLSPDEIAWEFDTFARARALWEYLRDRPADLVHVFSHDAAVAVAMTGLVAPVVATFSEMATEADHFGSPRSRFVYSLDALSLVTASSDFYADVARRYGFPENRIRRVMTGVDLDRFADGSARAGRQLLGLNATIGPVVVCPSRFTSRKGQLDLVRALSLMRERPLLVLLGSAHSGSLAYLSRVRELIAELEITRHVRIIEGVPHQEMPHIYAAADVVVQPSYGEGLGLSALEAMAAGVSLLATDVSGFDAFLVDGHNSLTVPAGRPDALADRLTRLLSDPELRRSLAARAAVDARARFGVERTATELQQAYHEAMDRTGVGR